MGQCTVSLWYLFISFSLVHCQCTVSLWYLSISFSLVHCQCTVCSSVSLSLYFPFTIFFFSGSLFLILSIPVFYQSFGVNNSTSTICICCFQILYKLLHSLYCICYASSHHLLLTVLDFNDVCVCVYACMSVAMSVFECVFLCENVSVLYVYSTCLSISQTIPRTISTLHRCNCTLA